MLDNTGSGIALTDCYCDWQPKLLYHLYEELGEDKPAALTDLFSPAKSSQPPSVSSALGSAAPSSHGSMAPPPSVSKA